MIPRVSFVYLIIPIVNTMRKKKDPAPPIPDVHWTDDMTWTLLSEVEKDSNRLVLLGKREKKEVSTIVYLPSNTTTF